MKKKIALLFALLMVLPVSVWGQSVPQSPYHQPLSLDIPLAALQGMNTGGEYGLFLDVVLGGGGNLDSRRFDDTTLDEVAVMPGAIMGGHGLAGYSSRLFSPNALGHSDTYRIFIKMTTTTPGSINTSDVIPANANGTLRITMQNVLVNHPYAQVGVRVVGMRGNAPVDFWVVPMAPVVSQLNHAHVTFEIESAVNFSHLLALRTISVHENAFENFDESNLSVRLEAPAFFRWETGVFYTDSDTERRAIGGSTFAAEPAGGASWHPIPAFAQNDAEFGERTIRRIENVDGLDRDVLYIPIGLLERGSGAMAETIEISNLFLLPESRAGSGEIDIHIATVAALPSLGTAPIGGLGGRLTRRPDDENNVERAAVLNVGYRTDETIEFAVLGDIPNVRTGYLGMYSRESNDLRGVQTATVELRELTPGAWGAAVGSPIEFTFDQPGVTVIGATSHAGWNTDRDNLFDERTVWINRTGAQWEAAYGNKRISPTNISVTMPNSSDSDFEQFYHLRALSVTFFISVEAGFESKFPNEDIYVTVGGAGVGQLSDVSRTLAIARPVDPIGVSLPRGAVQLAADGAHQIINQQISDIEITILEPHLLNHGSEIWVYVSGNAANRNLKLNLHANQNMSVNNSNLQIGPGRWLGQQSDKFGAIVFPIIRVPSAHEAAEPITMRIEDVFVTGNVMPGIDYYVVISGSAFAENDQIIFHDRFGADSDVGIFTNLSYTTLAIGGEALDFDTPPDDYDAYIYEDIIFEDVSRAVSVSPFDSFEGVVGSPIIFREIAGANVGFVSARAFAALIHSHQIFADTPTVGTYTIVGNHTGGSQVAVSMQSDSSDAIVYYNGVPHPINDIAAWAGSFSGVEQGELTSINVDGNLYLPFRAVANIFGYDVEMVNAFTVLFTEIV